MNTEPYITFQKFNNPDEASEFETLFKKNNIEYELESSNANFIPTLNHNEFLKEYFIKIRKQDFKKADDLLLQITLQEIENVDYDYYLFDFTNEELLEVIEKRDEWSRFDFLLAQKILKDRGNEIKPEAIELLKEERIDDLSKAEESPKVWIYIGYILAFIIPPIGIFIGWHLFKHKKTLPNGDSVYAYSESNRKHGLIILSIGTFVFSVIWIIRLVGLAL